METSIRLNEESRALEDQRVGFRLVDIPGIPHIVVFGWSLYIYNGSSCKALLGTGRLKLDAHVYIVFALELHVNMTLRRLLDVSMFETELFVLDGCRTR